MCNILQIEDKKTALGYANAIIAACRQLEIKIDTLEQGGIPSGQEEILEASALKDNLYTLQELHGDLTLEYGKDEGEHIWYVNTYEVYRAYGGPEEGGWWYDIGKPVSVTAYGTREEAKAQWTKLLKWAEKANKDEGRDNSSVNGTFEYRVRLEGQHGRHYPMEQPYYC